MTAIYKAIGTKGKNDFHRKQLVDRSCNYCGKLRSEDAHGNYLRELLWDDKNFEDVCPDCQTNHQLKQRIKVVRDILTEQRKQQEEAQKHAVDMLNDIDLDIYKLDNIEKEIDT